MKTVTVESLVGADGTLLVHVPLGPAEANARVRVTIEAVRTNGAEEDAVFAPWSEFVERTYGSCAGMGLERPPQPPSQCRDSFEDWEAHT